MIDWIGGQLQRFSLTGGELALGALLFVATLVLSFGIVLMVLVRLPHDHLCLHEGAPHRHGPRPHWCWRLARNALGALLVVLGLLLALPGVPGQGLVTVFAGVLLLDFPGRLALLRKIMAQPALLRTVNRLRARFGRRPLVID
jgi:hypothetical protein